MAKKFNTDAEFMTGTWQCILSILSLICLEIIQKYKENEGIGKNKYRIILHFLDILTRVSNTWRRQWHPTPVLFPGKSHGWRSLVGCSPWGCEESDLSERLHFHFSLSCLGEGNGNPSSVLAWRIPGMGSLVGCHLWGRTESDTTEATQQQQQQQQVILAALTNDPHISDLERLMSLSHPRPLGVWRTAILHGNHRIHVPHT